MKAEVLISDVVSCVRKWVQDTMNSNPMVAVEIVVDKDTSYRAIFETDDCMAQIVVAHPEFAPYRSISFEVAAIMGDKADIIYSWYDCDGDSESDIIEQLSRGILYAINYRKKEQGQT